jgi:hypothetical protein
MIKLVTTDLIILAMNKIERGVQKKEFKPNENRLMNGAEQQSARSWRKMNKFSQRSLEEIQVDADEEQSMIGKDEPTSSTSQSQM